eukprot:jgi/Mesvir1/27968/Mv20173-RA.1
MWQQLGRQNLGKFASTVARQKDVIAIRPQLPCANCQGVTCSLVQRSAAELQAQMKLPVFAAAKVIDILSTKGANDCLFVDCRDEERAYSGHIPGSRHFPSKTFEDSIPTLLQVVKDARPGHVIFFCSYSQVRGPKCAQKFAEAVAKHAHDLEGIQPVVLEDGFLGWMEKKYAACECPDLVCTYEIDLKLC